MVPLTPKLSEIAKARAERVKLTPNNVAPFMKARLKSFSLFFHDNQTF